ncbi:MAG: biotin carboxylase [Gammaproteobacteria bacterium]|jgi:biotin carboxylase|nr:biotin carboxylase [Gammaproteobacteria bacterium]
MNILVINRWSDEFANYQNYINHQLHQVAYITTPAGQKWLPSRADILTQQNLNDFELLLQNANLLSDKLGGIDLIIAMSESDLINAAKLREMFCVPGLNQKATEMLKNKVCMKDAIKKAGLLVPLYFDCFSEEAINNLIDQKGFPIILKPKLEAGSRGLHKVENFSELHKIVKEIELNRYECEEYIEGEVFHIDGVVVKQDIKFIKASKYILSCLDFRYGRPVGSVVIDDVLLNKRLKDFTEKALKALSLDSGIFHLEVIYDKKDQLFFLEIGARMGGGESNVVIRDVFGVNLAECWVKIQLQEPLPEIRENNEEYGGLLLMPEPAETPCKVQSCTSFIGKVPCLYKEILPAKDDVLDGKGAYEHISGRFLFRGSSSASIENSIREIMNEFFIETIPC